MRMKRSAVLSVLILGLMLLLAGCHTKNESGTSEENMSELVKDAEDENRTDRTNDGTDDSSQDSEPEDMKTEESGSETADETGSEEALIQLSGKRPPTRRSPIPAERELRLRLYIRMMSKGTLWS